MYGALLLRSLVTSSGLRCRFSHSVASVAPGREVGHSDGQGAGQSGPSLGEIKGSPPQVLGECFLKKHIF